MPDATRSPDAEDILSGDESFDVFDNTDEIREQNKEMAEERTKMEQAYASVFTTTEGRKVLQDLLDRYFKQQTFNPVQENAEKVGFYLEGQKHAIADIIQKTRAGQQKQQS